MTVQFVINNTDTGAAGGRTFDRHDPVTNKVASTAAAASADDARMAARTAGAAFPA